MMNSSGLSQDRLARLQDLMAAHVDRGDAPLLTNAAGSSPRPPAIALDFLTGAYAAIDD